MPVRNNNSYGLWRTDDPKFPLYLADGGGRDTHISMFNGGFCRNNMQRNGPPITGTHISQFKHSAKSMVPQRL